MSKNVGRLRGPFHHKDRLCIAERCMALRQYLLFQQIDLPTDLLADAAVCFFVSFQPVQPGLQQNDALMISHVS